MSSSSVSFAVFVTTSSSTPTSSPISIFQTLVPQMPTPESAAGMPSCKRHKK